MKRQFLHWTLHRVGIALIFALFTPSLAFAQDRPDFAMDTLVIETGKGARHEFEIELAVTPEERAYGLMFLKDMAANRGMLFDYGQRQRISMWMKDTFVPLDMLFIKENGEISRVVERTTPRSLKAIHSHARVRAVLEIRGGTAERLSIAEGDRVVHEIFE